MPTHVNTVGSNGATMVPSSRALSPRALCGITAAVGLALTAVLSLLIGPTAAVRSVPGHVTVETTATVMLALAAYLTTARARQSGEFSDALLAIGLAVLAISTATFSLLPTILDRKPAEFSAWAAFGASVIACGCFFSAAFTTHRTTTRSKRLLDRLMVAALVAIAAVSVVVSSLTQSSYLSGTAEQLRLGPLPLPQSSLVSAVHLALAVLLLGAAWILIQRDAVGKTHLLWATLGVVLYATAETGYAIAGDLSTGFLYLGDLFRAAAFLAFLVGAFRGLESSQRNRAQAAVSAERSRLARELHDGLAQELAYITAQARRLAGNEQTTQIGDHLVSASNRALAESRLAIAALIRPTSEPLSVTIKDTATSFAKRAGIFAKFDLQEGVEVQQSVREELLRIISESISNAARHGSARSVTVSLREIENGVELCVRDDGRGFDRSQPTRPDSLGLVSMRERAATFDGAFKIESTPGKGAAVTLFIPTHGLQHVKP